MEKPTIFFSHSSNDSNILQNLKDKILEITGSTVNIFLSSDGQSIPLGKNWVHEIEEALDDASLMFVFVSPNSIDSNWIHFEAGYGYSKGISVIVVGINGIDIGQMSPPLSLLQGFNLHDYRTLNNIIATINEHNSTTFKESFNEDSYNEIFSPFKGEHNKTLIQNIIDEVIIFFSVQILAEDIEEIFQDNDINFHKVNENVFISHGIQIELHNNLLKITWSKLFEYKDVINTFAKLSNPQSMHKKLQLRFVLKANIGVDDDFKNVSEILQEEVGFVGQQMKYKDSSFTLFNPKSTNAQIDIYPQGDEIDFKSIMEIFNLFIEKDLFLNKSYAIK